MTIDIHAYIGHWFARRLRITTSEDLVAQMDEYGLHRAVVASASAIMYRNCQPGNEDLLREIEPYGERFIPFAVIDPSYVEWQKDLEWCIDRMGIRGVRIYPQYDPYTLADPCCDELCEFCNEHGLVVAVSQRVEDYRQKREVLDYVDPTLDELADLFERNPETRFIVLNGRKYFATRLITEADSLPDNYWVEISRLNVFLKEEFGPLVRAIGASRLLFGTGMPLKMVGPVLLKMEHVDLSKEDKALIYGGNAEKLLGLT